MAKNVVDYINRAGRTARFGKPGTSIVFIYLVISFVEESDEQLYGLIE
jgi:superfamily II DNA/RNA helicase